LKGFQVTIAFSFISWDLDSHPIVGRDRRRVDTGGAGGDCDDFQEGIGGSGGRRCADGGGRHRDRRRLPQRLHHRRPAFRDQRRRALREVQSLKPDCLSDPRQDHHLRAPRVLHVEGQEVPLRGSQLDHAHPFLFQWQHPETTATCEFASSGLPAAYNCEREVVTFDSAGNSGGGGGGLADSCGPGTVWNHNGSTMRPLANGATRRFAYERPRRGLERAGINQCDVVFEGEKQGDSYVGTAYVFSRDCGPIGHPVSGPVTKGGLKVTLYGQAPRRRDDCSVSGYRDDTLVFEYVRSE